MELRPAFPKKAQRHRYHRTSPAPQSRLVKQIHLIKKGCEQGRTMAYLQNNLVMLINAASL